MRANASGTRGELVTGWGPSDDPILGRAVVPFTVAVLRRLGYDARPQLEPSAWFAQHPKAFRTIQMTPPGWTDSTPYGFLATFFFCRSSLDHRWFCDARFTQAVQYAQSVETENPQAW
jgi:hypothetical protein